MEFAVTITGLVCLALFIGPIYYFHRSGKKMKKQMFDSFIARAREISLDISELDLWNKSMIGIDSIQKKLLYSNMGLDSGEEVLLDLNNFSGCRAVKQYNEIKSEEGNYKSLDKITLEFIQRNNKLQPVHIIMYESDKSNQLNDELQLAQKWSEYINKSINNK